MDVRAGRLPKEYRDKARHIDRMYNAITEDQVGPVESKLNSFGELKCLVMGQFGESSQHLQELLVQFAEERAKNLSRSAGVALNSSHQALILQQYRRRLSVCAIRAQSACLLSRLSHFSEGARLGAQRRSIQLSREEASRKDLKSHWSAHIKGRGLHKTGLLHI